MSTASLTQEKPIGEIVIINDPKGVYDGLEVHPDAPDYEGETRITIGVGHNRRLIRRLCSDDVGPWLVLEDDQSTGWPETIWVRETPRGGLVFTGEIGVLEDWHEDEEIVDHEEAPTGD